MRISDWSSDVCSSDLLIRQLAQLAGLEPPQIDGRGHRVEQRRVRTAAIRLGHQRYSQRRDLADRASKHERRAGINRKVRQTQWLIRTIDRKRTVPAPQEPAAPARRDRKSTRLNSSH